MQRKGRAARNPDLDAMAVYFVDSDHFSLHREAKAAKLEVRRAKRKRLTSVSDENQPTAAKRHLSKSARVPLASTSAAMLVDFVVKDDELKGDESDIEDDEDRMDVDEFEVAHHRELAAVPIPIHTPPAVLPNTRLLPSPEGMSPEEYEIQAMQIYIDAGHHKVCRRRVTNEYFGNHKCGEQVLSISCIRVIADGEK